MATWVRAGSTIVNLDHVTQITVGKAAAKLVMSGGQIIKIAGAEFDELMAIVGEGKPAEARPLEIG